MKVLYIIDTLNGYGAEKSIVQIAINLKTTTPIFVQLYKGDSLVGLLEKNSVKVYSLNLKNGYKNGLDKISTIIAIEKPDIIHATLFRAESFSRKLKAIFPAIILVGSFVSNSYGRNRFKQLSLLSKLKLKSTQIQDRLSIVNVDYFISNSQAIKESNIKALDIDRNKVEVIYRGRNFDDFYLNSKVIQETKNELEISDKNIVFLNIARLSKGKGQIDLIKAFKKISENNPSALLFIAGEGYMYNELNTLIIKLKLEHKIILLGYRNDINILLHIADFFVFPSYFEGLPGALIEAILSKTPCIISDISENMECFPDNSSIQFKLGNVEDLALKMGEALTIQKWNLKTMLAFEYARQNFDINKVSKSYDEFYQKILLQYNNKN